MNQLHVFVSFDTEHDEDLYDRLLAESESRVSRFAVSGCSDSHGCKPDRETRVRGRIRAADQVIFICGEHTDCSPRMTLELRLAREEGVPYFLLWGRRDRMCTKPTGARPADGMYSWTPQIVEDQIAVTRRKARSDATAERLRRPGV